MEAMRFGARTLRAMALIGMPVLLLAIPGCSASSGGVDLVPVRGTVTYQGQPLARGRITFMPNTPGNTSSGEIVDGAYALGTYGKSDGAPPGQYKVAISSWVKEPDMESEGEPGIPKRYFDAAQSQLTADVKEGGAPIDFDLRD